MDYLIVCSLFEVTHSKYEYIAREWNEWVHLAHYIRFNFLFYVIVNWKRMFGIDWGWAVSNNVVYAFWFQSVKLLCNNMLLLVYGSGGKNNKIIKLKNLLKIIKWEKGKQSHQLRLCHSILCQSGLTICAQNKNEQKHHNNNDKESVRFLSKILSLL